MFAVGLFFVGSGGGMPTACGSSWVRDQTHATTGTPAAAMPDDNAMTMPDP